MIRRLRTPARDIAAPEERIHEIRLDNRFHGLNLDLPNLIQVLNEQITVLLSVNNVNPETSIQASCVDTFVPAIVA